MKKKVLAIGLILAFAILTVPIPAVFADSPMIEVSGLINAKNTGTNLIKIAGDNKFWDVDTASTWSGGISGTPTGSSIWIAHGTRVPPPDTVNIHIELTFTTASVDGKTGTMTVEMNIIQYPADESANHGTWRIKDASGGLEGLHGEGIWLSAPNRYEGKVHFSP